jgi:hypothetical protein
MESSVEQTRISNSPIQPPNAVSKAVGEDGLDRPSVVQNQTPSGSHDPESRSGKPGLIRKAGAFVYSASGFRYAARNAAFVKKRATFPLLRQISKDEIALQKTIVNTQAIRSELLTKTKNGQTILVAFFSVLLLWSILLMTKGIIVYMKYGDPLNAPLIASLPLIVLSSMRILIGLKVIRNCKHEILLRQSKRSQ